MISSTQLTVAEAFSEAVLHDRHYVLGRELQPFCLDHWLLLDALNSPLLREGDIAIHDLQLAVKVCSTRNIIEFYDVSLRPSWTWRLWARVTRSAPVAPTLAAFNVYIDDYLPTLPRWDSDGDGDGAKFPGFALIAARRIDAGHDPDRVRRMGLGEMIAWAYAGSEAQGDPIKSIKSEAEVLAARAIAAEERA